MDYDNLDATERQAYRDTVFGSHHRRVYFHLLRLNGDHVREIDAESVISAAVHGDNKRAPREILELDVYDDDNLLDWRLGKHRHYMIRVIDSRFVEELDDWVERVAFTGPLWDFDREGPVVSMVAQGPERLAMGSIKKVFKRPRKAKGSEVVRDLLALAGARKGQLLIPRLKKRLPERVQVGVERGPDRNKEKKGKQQRTVKVYRAGTSNTADTYWGAAEPVAEAMGRVLFGDPRCRFVMSGSAPKLSVTNRQVIGQVTERRGNDGEVTNTWEVFGRNPKGDRPQVHVVATLPDKHPSSAKKMAWNGEPRKVIETIENQQLDWKEAKALAKRKRDQGIAETVEREVQLLPVIACVRPGMKVLVGNTTIRARLWTVGFTQDSGTVTIGGNRRRGL